MPRTPPGQTRSEVYRFVRERLLAGRPPTLREIQAQLGFRAVETAREHLAGLVSEGKLVHEPGRSRGYALPGRVAAAAPLLVPLLGRVQAGALVTAVEELEDWVPVASGLAEADALFALRVRGESMRGAGILPGDIVVVRRDATAKNGDIVVALVDDEATVKRLRRGAGKTRGQIELHPENPAFEVIVRPAREVTLLGKVVEVRRYLDAQTRSLSKAPE
jgi:repressor LexA